LSENYGYINSNQSQNMVNFLRGGEQKQELAKAVVNNINT